MIKKMMYKCEGCGVDRPCVVETNQEPCPVSYPIEDLKCILDETNQTGFLWKHVSPAETKALQDDRDNLANDVVILRQAFKIQETNLDNQAEAIAKLKAEDELNTNMLNTQSVILTNTAKALKGEPEPLTQHSNHDLAEVATALTQRLADVEERALLFAFIQGYGAGHNDTVESAYSDPEERALDWMSDAREDGSIKQALSNSEGGSDDGI